MSRFSNLRAEIEKKNLRTFWTFFSTISIQVRMCKSDNHPYYEGEGEGGESADERDETAPGRDEQEEDAGQGAHH